MKRILISLLIGCLIFPSNSYSAAVIFSGNDVKTLKDNIDLNGNNKILSSATDPTASAVSAPVGSLLLNTSNGKLYRKLDSGSSTNWQVVGGSNGISGNLLQNPDFETNASNWTASGGTFARTTTAAQIGSGAGAGSWDSNAASQTLTSDAVAIPAGLYAQKGTASCKFKCASGTCTHKIQAYDGTNVIAEDTIVSSTSEYPRASVGFSYPSTGNIQLRVISVASDEPAVYIDDCYLGASEGFDATSFSQAELVGTVKVTSCASSWTKNTTSYASYSTASSCSYTATGNVTAPSTNLPAITVPNAGPGKYVIEYQGSVERSNSVSNHDCFFRFHDGTNAGDSESYVGGSASTTAGDPTRINVPGFNSSFTYTTGQGSKTFEIQAKSDGSTNASCRIYGTTASPGIFRVYRYPLSSETVLPFDKYDWHIDVNIAGANPSLGTSSVSTYTGIENSSLTMTTNTGSHAAQIPCSSTNASSGSTCSVGSESVGVVFNAPYAGKYEACADFTYNGDTASSSSVRPVFQWVETPNTAQTISQEGNTRVGASHNIGAVGVRWPFHVCGEFTFSSQGQKTLRLFYEQFVTGTVNTSELQGDEDTNSGQWNIRITVKPITQFKGGITFNNSVSSSASYGRKLVSAYITNSGTPTVSSQDGNWISSLTDNGAGDTTINFVSGTFSATPNCVFEEVNAVGFCRIDTTTWTSSAIKLQCFNLAGSANDTSFTVACLGAK